MKDIAVVGAGYWGQNLIRNFYELGVLKTVFDQKKEASLSQKERFPGLNLADSWGQLLSDPDIIGVVIATPAETHYELASDSLKAGKHVFVEKPLALFSHQAGELIQKSKEAQKVLMVGHLLLYHPAVLKLKELIAEGRLGKLEYIYSNRLNLGKVRKEENILWSFAPHDISVILFLLESDPILVEALGGTYLQPGIQDVTMTTMKFPNGVMAHIYVSWLHPFKEQRLMVIGDRSMAVFEDSLPSEKLRLYDRGIDWIGGEPVKRLKEPEVIPISREEPLKLECQHFLDCINKNQKPRTDGENGLKVLSILEQAQRSMAQKERMVFQAPFVEPTQGKYFVHPTAVVDESCAIGEGTKIWHFSHIQGGSRIGWNCSLGQNVNVGNNVTIGNYVKIQNNVSVYEGVELEDYVFCGPSMVFTNIKNPRSEFPQKGSYIRTLVKRGTSLGANATILCGITIGKYAFIGAGAVVTKDVPDYALLTGNPAKIRGWMCRCGTKLQLQRKEANCSRCGRQFRLKDGKIAPVSGEE
ncbi:Gfo/Idh/MocA family oxidoreductase [candidate division KSB1 bacterium]|nr:Gfo/Idh/MocA family oxidoreductase [candidate division KSB1 bacterium]